MVEISGLVLAGLIVGVGTFSAATGFWIGVWSEYLAEKRNPPAWKR